MEFGLLGPLVVDTGESRVTITAGKQRVVLAALLLRANQVVPASDLARAVWDGSPPPAARVTLQNYVKRLRQALGPAGYERIVTLPAGYLIKAETGELDVTRFRKLAAAGRSASAAGAWDKAAERFGAALALWRGRPLADVPSRVLAAQAPGLAGMRLDVAEARVDAVLHLGRPQEVLAELQSLVAAEPLRERLWALLMLALYRSGQQAAALTAYRQVRRRLVERVGVEPGPGLRELNQQMLRSDPGLLLSPPGRPAGGEGEGGGEGGGGGPDGSGGADAEDGSPPAIQPCLLPTAVAGFTGRSREMRALSARMPAAVGPQGPGGGPVVITAIGGTAGVGKTALAVHWARQNAGAFPDGQLYVNLLGFGPADPVAPAETLRMFLDALQVPAAEIPAGLDSLQALYRSTLAGKRALIVLDNARDPDQVRPLLPGTPTALVLVTSRSKLASLAVTDGATQVSLDVLPAAEARQLLARRLGQARVAAEPQAAGELIELCARLPLALAITAARAAAHPSFSLAALAAELSDARSRLDVLSTGDEATDVRAVFSWSYRGLDAPAARIFRLLGLHPGPGITAVAAASLAGTGLAEAQRLLRELARRHLLAEPAPGRYAFHDLLRAYAAEQAEATDDEASRRAAVSRILDHYLHTAHAAAQLLDSSPEPVTFPPPQPGVMPERLDGHQQARDWSEAEHHVLLAVVALAAAAGFDRHAWQLPWAMFTFLDGYGHWHEQAAIQRTAVQAAARSGDRAGQAIARRDLALACTRLGDYDQARAHLADCLGLYRELGDQAGQARVHRSLGFVADQQGRYGDALGHCEQALALFQATGDQAGQAFAQSAAGWCHARLGDQQRARTFCRQALDLYRELGDRAGEAYTWDSLGYVEHHLGRLDEAADCYQQALGLFHELGNRVTAGETLTRLGDTRQAAGNPGAARRAWQQALDILDDLDHPGAADVRGKLQRLAARQPHLAVPQPG